MLEMWKKIKKQTKCFKNREKTFWNNLKRGQAGLPTLQEYE